MFFVSKKKYKQLLELANKNQDAYWEATRMGYDALLEMELLRDALQDIINQQTKAGNATVTRMVKIAQEALDGNRKRQEDFVEDGEA